MKKGGLGQIKKLENEALGRVKEQEQIKLDKALLELEKKHQEQIQKLKEDKQTEIDKYQSKYLDLLETIRKEELTRVNGE